MCAWCLALLWSAWSACWGVGFGLALAQLPHALHSDGVLSWLLTLGAVARAWAWEAQFGAFAAAPLTAVGDRALGACDGRLRWLGVWHGSASLSRYDYSVIVTE
jgi:hypothetical protein